ncbi:hypothetical protein [Clostridium cylindrosporum]|uniref:Uncharacterized protein n=1 Tax=Clostridium cylindrosporum DSM 605 TaxID=1121307 RepID=A0A0J8D8J1_CLOCY|nr:hypothetical protein [Clostridium cylindrosporum]KMT22375.1 hypothetical protein CLCY_13c00100 [Clostridium cylindrosporum DSM 605]
MNKIKALLVLIIPVLILIAISIQPFTTKAIGKEIIVEKPYIEFKENSTENIKGINVVPLSKLKDYKKYLASGPSKNNIIYVQLERSGEIYKTKYVSDEKPKSGVYLKAKIDYIDETTKKAYIDLGNYNSLTWDPEAESKAYVKLKVLNGLFIVEEVITSLPK